jgi:hypothetical protein
MSLYGYVLLACLAATLFPNNVNAEQPCLKKAWAAMNQSNHQQALEAAEECIDQFSARALRDESALEAAQERPPATGVVESAFDKKKIFDRGVLNDVAASYFVRGQAAERLLKKTRNPRYKQVAVESYTAAARLKYGRCFDPGGFFWSPAEAASDRLMALK